MSDIIEDLLAEARFASPRFEAIFRAAADEITRLRNVVHEIESNRLEEVTRLRANISAAEDDISEWKGLAKKEAKSAMYWKETALVAVQQRKDSEAREAKLREDFPKARLSEDALEFLKMAYLEQGEADQDIAMLIEWYEATIAALSEKGERDECNS